MTAHSADRIFEPGERTWTEPMRHTEGLWSHLNKRGSPGYDGVRALIDDWYGRVRQGQGRRDLGAKLRSNVSETWHAGFWELYLHESLSRAGYELDIEPSIAGSPRRPDFLARGHGHEFYVEALAVLEDQSSAERRRQAHIYDYLNDHPHPSFSLGLQFHRMGATGPHLRRLVGDVTRWFDGLDPDATPFGASIDWREGEWEIELLALPKPVAARGIPGGRLIATYSGWTGWSDMGTRIRTKLHSKATRYGRLDKPYLIALTVSSFLAENDDLESALLGPEVVQYYEEQPGSARVVRKHDGLFMAKGGRPQNTRVSGLIVAWNVTCTHIGLIRPATWLNPWAQAELRFEAPLPFDRVVIDPATGGVSAEPSDFEPLPYFGLPPNWPGFEDRLIGRRRIVRPRLIGVSRPV